LPKGIIVLKQVINLVGTLLSEDEKMTGKELKASVEDKIPQVNYTIRTYQSIKKKLLPKLAEIKASGLDNPWSLGTLVKHPLPAEIIPQILKVKEWATGKHLPVVSNRQAKWISRLYAVIKDNKSHWNKPLERSLWKASFIYTSYEIICDLTQTDPDTSEMDKVILKGEHEFTLGTVYKKPNIDKAVEAATYQYYGLGKAKHYLEYLENLEKEG